MERSEKNGLVLLLLTILLPTFHYVYVGKIGLALLFFLTGGGFGLWYLIDIVRVIMSKFPDKDGRPIVL